jgi:hypothetical protein
MQSYAFSGKEKDVDFLLLKAKPLARAKPCELYDGDEASGVVWGAPGRRAGLASSLWAICASAGYGPQQLLYQLGPGTYRDLVLA